MALTQVKTLGIEDDAVTSAKIADDAVVTAAIADDAVTGANIADDTVAEANMANDAIGLAELKAGTDGQILTFDASGNPTFVGPGTDGQVLTSTGAGSPPAFEAIPAGGISDVVSDTSPQLGGDLDTNSFEISLDDSHKIKWGDGDDLQIYHDGSASYIDDAGTGILYLRSNQMEVHKYTGETMAQFVADSAVNLYYDNAKKFETTADGVTVTGGQYTSELKLYTSDGTQRGKIYSTNGNDTVFQSGHNETYLKYTYDGQVELYHDNTEVVETDANGLSFVDGKGLTFGNDDDYRIYHGADSKWIFQLDPNSTLNVKALNNDATNNIPLMVSKSGSASNNERHSMISFALPGNHRGIIQSGSSISEAPALVASSDYRIKENFRPYTGGWDAIKAIPVQLYDEKSPSYWTQGSDKKDQKGWKAHEVQAVIPEAVSGDKDAVVTQALIDTGQYQQSELNQIIPQQLGTTAMIPTLIGALQQAMARIETLETEVAALKAA